MFSSSSRGFGSHDSSNVLPSRVVPPPFSGINTCSVPTSFGDLQPGLQTSSFRNTTPNQRTVSNCSCCSHSSNLLCPRYVSKIISGGGCGWNHTGYSYNPGIRGYSNINFSSCCDSYRPEISQPVCYQLPTEHVAVEQRETPKLSLPPINSKRLRPLRQKTKNVVLNILESGEVCLEFLRNKDGTEKVVDVLRISSDGLRLVIYHPNRGKGVPVSEKPPPLPPGGADELCNYENIPQKHWKKYTYASRFVDAVKTKTAKVIYYSLQAKCFLMENSPDPDFEAAFYEGAKVNKTGNQVKLVYTNGWTSTVHITTDGISFPPSVKLIWNQFKSYLSHCLKIEKAMEQMSLSTEEVVFPIIIGRRPATFQRSLLSSKKESSSVLSEVSVPVVSHTDSVSGSRRGTKASRNKILKQIDIPNVGHAVQMTSGVVCIQYPDSSKLFVDPSTSKVTFTDSAGSTTNYQQSDVIPSEIREKLGQLPVVFEALMNTS